MNPFQVDPRSLPHDGRYIEGSVIAAFFKLAPADPVQAVSPMTYSLDIVRDDKDIIVTGDLAATFSLECGRCTERFQHRLHLPHYSLEMPVENNQTMDLTDAIREDILLALPSYPRCEDGNITPRACPAEGRFEHDDHHDGDAEPQNGDRGVWDALDKLQN
jgi:uncharacterized protein